MGTASDYGAPDRYPTLRWQTYVLAGVLVVLIAAVYL
jgi:hypothetical protein